MALSSAERVRQIVDCITAESIAPLVRQYDLADNAKMLFKDQVCRDTFERELTNIMLASIIGGEKALMLAPNFMKEVWDTALKTYEKQRKNKLIPKLKLLFPENSPQAQALNVSYFALQQYSFKTITVNEDDIVLDFGAGMGHFAFWADSKKAKRIYSFEANPSVYAVLEENVKAFDKTNIIALNAFLAHDSGKAEYAVNKTGEKVSVPVIAPDKWAKELAVVPNYLKVSSDNGNTMLALAGAQELIKEHRPQIAVVINRKLSDMWEVPLFIKKLVPAYSLFCRKNAPIGDFVLYASVSK